MRDETVARNYAETLFELASRNDALQEYGDAIEAVAKLIDEDAKFRLFMETPRIDDADKKAVVRKAFADSLPKHVVNFILVTIDKRRQRLLELTNKGVELERRLSESQRQRFANAYRDAGAGAVQGFRDVLMNMISEEDRERVFGPRQANQD